VVLNVAKDDGANTIAVGRFAPALVLERLCGREFTAFSNVSTEPIRPTSGSTRLIPDNHSAQLSMGSKAWMSRGKPYGSVFPIREGSIHGHSRDI
jgi:hypothetical protein